MTWEVEERKKGENCGGAVSFAFLSSSLHLREIIGFRRVACLACRLQCGVREELASRDHSTRWHFKPASAHPMHARARSQPQLMINNSRTRSNALNYLPTVDVLKSGF
jgi:hypothetical protein